MTFIVQVVPRIEKDFKEKRLFYVTPDPKVYEIHLETSGVKKPFMLGYANNLLEEVREIFTPKRNDPAFVELREKLKTPDTKVHLCFYFFTPTSDFRKPIEMLAGKWLKWRKENCEFPHAIDDDYLEALGASRSLDVEFEGDTADVELYK